MYNIIKELEADNSRLIKESILKREADAGNIEFFNGVRMALDSYITYGVKKIPIHGGPDGQGLSWDAFAALATYLYKRELTGHAARDAIELAMSVATQDEWNYWYRRILLKDLRCGMSEKTVNKVLKEAEIPTIPVFDVMLAHDGMNHEKKIAGKKQLEHKLDGVRCITVIDHEMKTVTQFTRNGKSLENFSHITDALIPYISDFGRSYVIDGEIVSKSFQDLMKQVQRKTDVTSEDATLVAFDIIPLSEFLIGKSTITQARRSKMLDGFKYIFDKITESLGRSVISIVDRVTVDLDSIVGELEFKQYNKDAIAAGYEGIMVKSPEAVYECKRSTSWLKIKPWIEVSLAVVDTEEGTGKNIGKLGALICEGIDDGKRIIVNVGSGFTDIEREEYWTNKDDLLGQVVEIRADAVTQSQDNQDIWSLRFPRFLRFRGFSAGEKI